MIRDDKKRAMLFELDNNIQSLKSRYGESEEIRHCDLYHNLLREWSDSDVLNCPSCPGLATLNCTVFDGRTYGIRLG